MHQGPPQSAGPDGPAPSSRAAPRETSAAHHRLPAGQQSEPHTIRATNISESHVPLSAVAVRVSDIYTAAMTQVSGAAPSHPVPYIP